jgi:hypothetical protein
MTYVKPKTHKKKRSYEDRRLGRDNKRITQDINIYRWFAIFIKCALELEDYNEIFKVRGKNYKVKFNRNHKWWKLIDLNWFPKTNTYTTRHKRLIQQRYRSEKIPTQMKKLSDEFWFKYKHLFVEKSTLINAPSKSVPKGYDTLHIPPNYPIMKILSDIRKFYSGKEVKLSSGRKKKSDKGQEGYNADIVLGDSNEQLMRRLFHTLSISQHWGHFQGRKFKNTYTSLDVYFNVQKRMDKSFVIPKIQRVNATGAIGSRTTTTRGKYDSKIRMTQRDIRWSKILIINLCNGVFPKIDKII